jgi:hypothetical protein
MSTDSTSAVATVTGLMALIDDLLQAERSVESARRQWPGERMVDAVTYHKNLIRQYATRLADQSASAGRSKGDAE